MDDSVKQGLEGGQNTGSTEDMISLRKQISALGVYGRMYHDFQKLLIGMNDCRELIIDSKEDKELKKLAEEDLASL